jgi:hypothetical protein
MKKLSRAFVVLNLFILGCEETPESPGYPELRIYLDRFEDEAKERGYDFDLTNVEAAYVDNIIMNGLTYCGWGYSNYGGSGRRRIEISKAERCDWLSLSDIERENFVFHEIGHAFLNRGHDDRMLCEGGVVSLMTGGPNYQRIYSATGDREYYISELIDPLAANTRCIQSEKDWSKDSVFYEITKNDTDWTLYTDNGKYKGSRSTANEAEEYLTLESIPGIDAQANGYWFKTFSSPNIPECAQVKFKVKTNSESLTGTGAAISVRAYSSTLTKYGAVTEQYLRVSTENDPLKGELVDAPQELLIPCYSGVTSSLIVFVVLRGQTQGKVTFNDIELLVKPQ